MAWIIDCAVLLQAAQEPWLRDWMQRSTAVIPKLRLHACPLSREADVPADTQVLAEADLLLQRFDVAVLPVSYATLSWTRTALSSMQQNGVTLPVPLLALVSELKAPAILDLYELGVTEFLHADASVEEARARLTQLTVTPPAWQSVSGSSGTAESVGRVFRPVNPQHTDGRSLASTLTLHESANPSYGAEHKTHEPFRVAKTRVVDSFEREYICRALSRHAGNISMAARFAHKHRRAFWALMRKHRIDASVYREASRTQTL